MAGPTGTETIFVDRKGALLLIRPAVEADRPALREFFDRLSARSLYLRFMQAVRRVDDRVLNEMVTPDFDRAATLLVFAGSLVIGVGQYVRESADAAEVAFVVDDRYQGRGIATELLYRLADAARTRGFRHFTALVRSENLDMLRVFIGSGFPTVRRFAGPEESLEMDITAPPPPPPWASWPDL